MFDFCFIRPFLWVHFCLKIDHSTDIKIIQINGIDVRAVCLLLSSTQINPKNCWIMCIEFSTRSTFWSTWKKNFIFWLREHVSQHTNQLGNVQAANHLCNCFDNVKICVEPINRGRLLFSINTNNLARYTHLLACKMSNFAFSLLVLLCSALLQMGMNEWINCLEAYQPENPLHWLLFVHSWFTKSPNPIERKWQIHFYIFVNEKSPFVI